MSVADRNQIISQLLQDTFTKLESGKQALSINPAIDEQLDKVFSTTVRGFREILLVITIGRILDENYKASVDFYACKPRAIYEGPIREQLQERGIPHGKSGPLNIAKATKQINEQWAAQRQPKEIGALIVSLVKVIDRLSQTGLKDFLRALASRFMKEAERVTDLSVETSPIADPAFLFNISSMLIDEVPDSGNTPQKIAGFLMQSYHEDLQTGLVVSGYQDRASATNTTSKKPGDLTEELMDGTVIKNYEITVKPFTQNRIIESYQAIQAFEKRTGQVISETQVICRPTDTPKDIINRSSSEYYLGKIEYRDKTYQFININEWLMDRLLAMSSEARLSYFDLLQNYIEEPNTAEAVKITWKKLNS